MQTSGPLPVLSTNPITAQDAALRLNQRIVAEVVEVAGTRVVLSVNGTPIVARLDPADQSGLLAGRRVAQFVVSALSEGEITLKLADNTPARMSAAVADIAASVLDAFGLEGSPANLLLARAAISQRLLITPALLEELSGFLGGLPAWDESDAMLAAAIKAAGLPLTAGVFERARQPAPPLGSAITDLLAALRGALQNPHLPEEARQALAKGFGALAGAVLDWGGSGKPSPAAIEAFARTFGQSMEHALLAQADGAASPDQGMLALGRMSQYCMDHPELELSDTLRRFLASLEQSHLANLRLDPVPGQGEWCGLEFALQNPPPAQPDFFPARIRIARREAGLSAAADAGSTRLQINVEISPAESILVDLTLAGERARAVVFTPNAELRQRSQEEMPGLVEALRGVGVQLQAADFAVGIPRKETLVTVLPASPLAARRVNMRV